MPTASLEKKGSSKQQNELFSNVVTDVAITGNLLSTHRGLETLDSDIDLSQRCFG